jgi:hypothetical protein
LTYILTTLDRRGMVPQSFDRVVPAVTRFVLSSAAGSSALLIGPDGEYRAVVFASHPDTRQPVQLVQP